MSRRLLLVAVLVLAAHSAWRSWQLRAVPQSPGMLVAVDPLQRSLGRGPQFERDGYRIDAIASYDITARLLRRESYRVGREAELSPLDFALGWGPMSDSAVIAALEITQGNRFYWLHWQTPPFPPEILLRTSANTHLIPADDRVARALDRMRPGQVVHLKGYLVNVSAADGWQWHSSTTRTDTGAGACELMWVEDALVEIGQGRDRTT